MLFLGLGTSLGATAAPRRRKRDELPRWPICPIATKTFQGTSASGSWTDTAKSGADGRRGDAAAAGLVADYVVLGGGNSRLLKELPPATRLGKNTNAFIGGFRMWDVDDQPPTS